MILRWDASSNKEDAIPSDVQVPDEIIILGEVLWFLLTSHKSLLMFLGDGEGGQSLPQLYVY